MSMQPGVFLKHARPGLEQDTLASLLRILCQVISIMPLGTRSMQMSGSSTIDNKIGLIILIVRALSYWILQQFLFSLSFKVVARMQWMKHAGGKTGQCMKLASIYFPY